MNLQKLMIALLMMLLFCIDAQSIELDSLYKKREHLPSTFYSQVSIGMAKPIYRDFATSPLFYTGIGINLNTSYLKCSEIRERIFRFEVEFGGLKPQVPKSSFIQPGGLALLGQVKLYYQRLWKFESLTNPKYNLKLGSAINITQNIRYNSALDNNAFGLENISNLMASAQITRDISRIEIKKHKLFTLNPVKRELRFLMNVGVLNFNYRPGYAYSYDSEINGTSTSPVAWVFSNYKWSMNGWRLNTQVEFIKYLSNGNARSWSYIWDAANVKGKFEPFQMANHRIQLAIYFHSKER